MRLSLILALLLPVCALAQEGKKGPPPEPKNLKVLTGMDRTELVQTMRGIAAALNVQCTFCHVQGAFESDEIPKKVTARMMLQMAREINAKFPDGKVHVTCYTCHRGSTEPATAPPPADPGAKQ